MSCIRVLPNNHRRLHDDYCNCIDCLCKMRRSLKALRDEMNELKRTIEKLKIKIRYSPGQEGAKEAEMEFRSVNS